MIRTDGDRYGEMARLGAVLCVAQYLFCDGTGFLLGFCSRSEEVLTNGNI